MAERDKPRLELALRELSTSRPVRAVRALLMRAVDAGLLVRAAEARDTLLEPLRRGRAPETPTERVRGLDDAITLARDRWGVPGIFARTVNDAAFGLGWACAEDRLFQLELMRRAFRGELAATFGARRVDDRALGRAMAGRTFIDLDAFNRAMSFRAAAEASYAIASPEARAWVDAYVAGINAYLASGRRPLEMLLLDMEPTPWTGADALTIQKGIGFQLSFAYRFAMAWALCADAVGEQRASHLRPVRHPLTVTRGDVGAIEPLVATTEMLRAVLGTDSIHLGSNAFAVSARRSALGRPILASDPHMPLGAPAIFWEARVRGGDLDVRGVCIPGIPAFPIGQNARAAWGATSGWGDDTQLYREDLVALRRDARLKTRRETITVRGQGTRTIELHETPRGPIVSHVLGDALVGASDRALSLKWSGSDATLDLDSGLALMRAGSFDDLRAAARQHANPSLNFVWADQDGHIGWQFAGRIPRRAGGGVVSGIDIADGEDPRAEWRGFVPGDELPFVRDPEEGVVVSANTNPCGEGYRHFLGELFEPPFRKARIHALLDARATLGLRDLTTLQRDVRSSWALQARDALLAGVDDEALDLQPRRGRDLVRVMRAWSGEATEDSIGATATHVFLEAVLRHLFLDDLGELAFEHYFEQLNAPMLPLLRVLGDDESTWLEGRDRATIVHDAAAMAEGRLRRLLGEDPSQWRWGALHTVTFRHALHDVPGLRAVSSPGPYPARGDGTTVCMGDYDMRGGRFAVRAAPAFRMVAVPGAPHEGRAVLPPGNGGDPSSKHYRDQIALYLAGELREMAWDETEFSARRLRLVP
ncbi:MAG: penicillin acylase family protein [Deltaproteobacteria bacterium]|nr:penicillin acylase family protein [Deltaproteobacteria bacterium]